MDIARIVLTKAAYNSTIPTNNEVLKIQNSFKYYKYPIGIFPMDTIKNNINYSKQDFNYIKNYFESLVSVIFTNIYTNEEQNIIAMYLTISAIANPKDLILEKDTISTYLNMSSNKAEIQYCIDEIKYTYLNLLIYVQNSTQEFNTLLDELTLIEQQHNNFKLDALI